MMTALTVWLTIFALGTIWIVGMHLIHRKRANPADKQGKPYIEDITPPSSGGGGFSR